MRMPARWLTVIVPLLLIAQFTVSDRAPSPQTRGRVVPLQSALPTQPFTTENLAAQTRCLAQGRSLYGALGYPKGRVAGYGTHYNQKLGKCFLDLMNMETATPRAMWMHRRLLETARGTEY